MKFILASGSEWRKRLLSWLNEPVEVVVSGVDESEFEDESAEELVERLAVAKAQKVRQSLVSSQLTEGRVMIVAADTVIVFEEEILGKPEDRDDAKRMIERLQGVEHAVVTGVCVMDADSGEMEVASEITMVRLRPMRAAQVEQFLDTDEWQGKAGGYQILKSIDQHIAEIEGSVTNVIGLPLTTLVDMLSELGVDVSTDVAAVIQRETGYEK
jgi:septum formation protein